MNIEPFSMLAHKVVKTLPHGRRGLTYPGTPWEPKQSFFDVAEFYASHQHQKRRAVDEMQNFPAPEMTRPPLWRLILGGICWAATLEFFAAQAIAQAAWRGSDYSLTGNAISDLGVTACGRIVIAGQPGSYCSPLHAVMNTSFVVTGVLMLLGLYLILPIWTAGRAAYWGAALLTLAGIGKIVVGLAPGNVNYGLHSLGSLGIIFANIGMIVLGSAVSETHARWMARLPIFLGILGLVGELFFLGHRALGGGGAAERVADYPVFVWMIALGVYCVRWTGRPSVEPGGDLGGARRPQSAGIKNEEP